MRYLLLTILFTVQYCEILFSQTFESYKKVCLGETEILTLNSVNATTLSTGGKVNRVKLAKEIPSMTEFILLQIKVDNSSAELDRQNSQDMLNYLKNATLNANVKLVAGATILAMTPPKTGHKCDFYLFPDRNNFNLFTERGTFTNWADNWVSCADPYRRINTQSFNLVIKVEDLKDNKYLYMGFRNNDNTNACRVFVDVFALIGNGWTIEVKDTLYRTLQKKLKNSIPNQVILNKTIDCFMSKLTTKIDYQSLSNLAEYEKKIYLQNILKDCNPDFNQTDEKSKGMIYGNLGWKAFERGEFEKCLELSNKALSLDSSLYFVHFNIALVCLIQGKSDAIDKYIDAIQICKRSNNAQQIYKSALEDIIKYEHIKGQIKGAMDIKELINSEIKK